MRSALLTCLFCASLVAQDKTLPKPFAEAKREYEAAAAGKDTERLVRALAELARSGLLSDEKAEKRVVQGALKRSLRHADPKVRIAAARGYAKLRLKGTSSDLRPILRQAMQGRQPHAVGLAVVEAWGEITDPGSHKDLLAMLKKPVDQKELRDLAVAAAVALGRYRALDRPALAKVVSDLMQLFDWLFAVAHRRAKEGSADVKWWNNLEKPLAGAFNTLTGQNAEDYYECYEWWQANRREFKSAK
ncbi:MAG: HEAT repeat domain-containing protein [Planctomycetota bacterium]